MRNLVLLAVFFLIYLIPAYSQERILISADFILRNQHLSTVDPGGYFISDQYTKRITYGLGVELNLTQRISVSTGIQRTFFVTDVNFWFLTSGYVLFFKSNPITGRQIPISINYNLVKFDSKSRWRLGASGGVSFSFINKSSGTGYGTVKNIDRTIAINYNDDHSPVRRNFITFDIGGFVKHRLSRSLWAAYRFSYLQSFAEAIVVNNIRYSVTTGSATTDYVAQTVANGNAVHHTLGIQFAF